MYKQDLYILQYEPNCKIFSKSKNVEKWIDILILMAVYRLWLDMGHHRFVEIDQVVAEISPKKDFSIIQNYHPAWICAFKPHILFEN